MPRKRPLEPLSTDRIRQLLNYNMATGVLTWRKDRGRNAKIGDEAGSVDRNGVVMIGIDGQTYTAARIAWAYSHGAIPTSRVRFRDGDSQNLAYDNLVLEGDATYSDNPRAKYQRRYRRDMQDVDARIRGDQLLFRRYANADKAEARAIRRQVLDEVHEARMRTHGHWRRAQ